MRFWLALARAPGSGGRQLRALLDCPGAPRALFTESAGALRKLGAAPSLIDYLRAPDWKQIDRDLDWLSEPRHSCIPLGDPRYPALLREIAAPPTVLYVDGSPDALARPMIAVVGSRNPTPAGTRTAFEFAGALCDSGAAIASGLAVGIDAAAHQGALARQGTTIAVVGTGPDEVYPRRHRRLCESIAESGAVVSEFPPGTPPRPANFPRRNRVISGLSAGTLVVEATLRSGSLITARLSLEQDREVFAIPGSIHNPLARGCHALIKQGAKLVEAVDDILEELAGFGLSRAGGTIPAAMNELDEASAELLKFVAWEPTSVDTLVAATGFSAEQVTSILVLLELSGHIASTAAGCYCRTT